MKSHLGLCGFCKAVITEMLAEFFKNVYYSYTVLFKNVYYNTMLFSQDGLPKRITFKIVKIPKDNTCAAKSSGPWQWVTGSPILVRSTQKEVPLRRLHPIKCGEDCSHSKFMLLPTEEEAARAPNELGVGERFPPIQVAP